MKVAELSLDELAEVTGGRTWTRTAIDYARACGDGALTAATMATPNPYTLGVGCAAGMAGQGLVDAIQYVRSR